MADDAAEQAYAAAVEEIARVVTSKERELSFNDKRFRALDRMPSELFQFMKLDEEYRNDTRKENNKLRSVKDKMILPYIIESKYSDIFQDKMRKSINLRNFVDSYTTNISNPDFLIENIRSINISNTNISDISFIDDSFDIVSFSAESTPISDISPLIKCKNIHDIDLSNTNIKDFSPISNLEKIRIAALRNINFSDFSFIKNLKSCYLLDLRNTNFKNLSILENNTKLEVLLLDNSLISDLSDIIKLKELAIIQLSETNILDLRPLISLRELEPNPKRVERFQWVVIPSGCEAWWRRQCPGPKPLGASMSAEAVVIQVDTSIYPFIRSVDGFLRAQAAEG